MDLGRFVAIVLIICELHRKKSLVLFLGSHTWRICPSLQAIKPLEGSLCHCLEPQVGHLRRPGVIEACRNQ